MLKATLPKILDEISAKREACVQELDSLGEDLSTNGARRLKFSSIVQELCTLVRETMQGSNTEWDAGLGFTLRARLEDMYRNFATDMRKTRLAGAVMGKDAKVLVSCSGKWLPGTVTKVEGNGKGEKAFQVDPAASLTEEDKKSFYRIDELTFAGEDSEFLEEGSESPEEDSESLRKMLKPFAEKDVRPDDYDFLRDRITKRQTRALQVRLRPATSDSDRA